MTMQTDIHPVTHQLNGRALGGLLANAARQNVILLSLLAAYTVAAWAVSLYTGTPIYTVSLSNIALMLSGLVPLFLVSMLIWRFAFMMTAVRPARPIGWLIEDFKTTLLKDHRRLLSGCIAILGLVFFAAVFTYVKEAIPQLNPFAWDQTFARMDQQLHGGVDPYVLLAPLFGNLPMMRIADTAYSLWFVLIYFFAFIACMDRDNPLRRNSFLIAFILSWIIGGSILAVMFSSVGPIYYQAFGLGDQFVPLQDMIMGIHAQQPLLAVELQTMLLDGYQNDGGLSGISAMPSMHLATSWIMAFHAFQYSRKLGWGMVGFAVVIQLSSVMLGWHYAIDGYLGFGIAALCWACATKLARMQDKISPAA